MFSFGEEMRSKHTDRKVKKLKEIPYFITVFLSEKIPN